jgi:hypothetical protein
VAPLGHGSQEIRCSCIAIAVLLMLSQSLGAQRPACFATRDSASDLATNDGRTVYVEPNSFAVDEGAVFLAGQPNYLFRGDSLDLRNGIFGVLTDGSPNDARIVPLPLADKDLGDFRVASLGHGRWAAVFAELAPSRSFLAQPRVIALWFAIFDGRSWTRAEKLPPVDRGLLRSDAASPLVRAGASLAIAYPLDSVLPGSPLASQLAVFTRDRDHWSTQVVRMPMVGSVSVAALDSYGLALAVVQPDTSQRSDGGSVFLYGPSPDWRNLGKVISGGERQTDDIVIRQLGTALSLSWHARLGASHSFGEARTARLPLSSLRAAGLITPVQQTVTLDSNSIQLSVPAGAGQVLWISEHVVAETPQAPTREFRIFADSSGIPVLIARAPDDFDGTLFGAAITAHATQLLIVGPSLRRTAENRGVLTTRVLRFHLDCRA